MANETDQIALNTQTPGQEAAELRATLAALSADREQIVAQLQEAQAKIKTLESELATTRERLGETSSVLPTLPAGAFELLGSVTVANASGEKIDPKKGDVVVTSAKEAEKVQKAVGGQAKVYAVTNETIAELKKLGLLR